MESNTLHHRRTSSTKTSNENVAAETSNTKPNIEPPNQKKIYKAARKQTHNPPSNNNVSVCRKLEFF
jgi:hypothetical protein